MTSNIKTALKRCQRREIPKGKSQFIIYSYSITSDRFVIGECWLAERQVQHSCLLGKLETLAAIMGQSEAGFASYASSNWARV